MDPIHPIVPQSPTLPPVAPSPRAEGVNRDGRGSGHPQERRRRRAADSRPPQTEASEVVPASEDDDLDDQRPRIDITV